MDGPRTSPDNLNPAEQSPVRIGTRGSPLALVQARQVGAALEALSGGWLRADIRPYTTKGDQLTSQRLTEAGGKGLFTRTLDLALDDGEIDIAVHSLKDVPTELEPGQEFYAFPERADPRDGFLARDAGGLRELAPGARIGTASLRRERQALRLRPDLKVTTFRGNVATRMRKLDNGEADATFLAMAGLERLGLSNMARPVPLDEMLPAAGQGIIAVVSRPAVMTQVLEEALHQFDHAPTRLAALSERAFLRTLDGSCRTPIAAHLEAARGGVRRFRGEGHALDGSAVWTAQTVIGEGAGTLEAVAAGETAGLSVLEQAGPDWPGLVHAG